MRVKANGACILQVEDEENDVLLLRDAFQKAGIEIPLLVAKDGREAMDYLAGTGTYADRSKHPLPALVLLDLDLPLQSGLDVLRWVQGQPSLKGLVIIVFSSSGDPADIDCAYGLGAKSFVVKPVAVEERVEFAQLLKAWWLNHNRVPSGQGEPRRRAIEVA